MQWIVNNWLLLLFGGGMIGMHLFGHGRHGGHGSGSNGHGGHGGCGGHSGHADRHDGEKSAAIEGEKPVDAKENGGTNA